MIELVYFSSATHLFSHEELTEILRISRRNNTQNNVTGLLLYHDGNIVQALEGEEENVRATFKRIEADPRHHGLIKCGEATISQRQFPDWSMGFANAQGENSPLEGHFDLFSRKKFEESGKAPSLARFFIDRFRLNTTLVET